MVRIRSSRWYSGENQKELRRGAPNNSSSTRRVVSLVFLLALVVVLMQKVSDPVSVSRAFEALGIPIEKKIVGSSHPLDSSHSPNGGVTQSSGTAVAGLSSDKSKEPTSKGDVSQRDLSQGDVSKGDVSKSIISQSGSGEWEKTCVDLIARLLDKASGSQIDLLALWVFAEESSTREAGKQPAEQIQIDAKGLIEQLRAKLDLSKETDQSWNSRLTEFQRQWDVLQNEVNRFNLGEPLNKDDLDHQFKHYLSNYLDRRLLEGLRDASPWVASETVGFGRMLQRGKGYQTQAADLSLVTTKQLETEAAQLRGSWVRYRGTVRLVEQVQRQQPLLQDSQYSVMWLQPNDGSTQPVAVYATQAIVEQIQRAVNEQQFPEIELTGLVGKKLAYGSAAGVQVAPTLFSGSIIQFAEVNPKPLPKSTGETYRTAAVAVVVAVLLSLIFTFPIWKQLRRRKSTSALGLALFATFAWGFSLCNSAFAQDPPWAKKPTDGESRLAFVEQRLQPVFNQTQVDGIRALIDGSSTAMPDFVLRAIFALNQVGWQAAWQPSVPISLPLSYQLQPVQLNGIAHSVQQVSLNESQQEWFSLQPTKVVYRLQIELTDSNATRDPKSSPSNEPPAQLLSVFTAEIPSAWTRSAQLKQPVQIQAFELRQAASESSAPPTVLCALANRVGWKLDEYSLANMDQLQPKIPAAWIDLAKAGWDMSWFDVLDKYNKKPLSNEELGPLVKLLEITAQKPSFRSGSVSQPLEVISQPRTHIGLDVDWSVRLVTGSLVEIMQDQKTIQYYQYDGFVAIPDGQTIKFDSGNGQTVDFKGEFPVTVLTSVDSPFVGHEQIKAGQHTWPVGKKATVRGRFLKLWSYESERLKASSGNGRLIAPLVVASEMSELLVQPKMNRQGSWMFYLVGLAVVIIASSYVQITFRNRARARK